MQTSLKLTDTRHIDLGAAVSHCTEMSFYPTYNFLSREYCLLSVKKFKNDCMRLCYLFHRPDQNFEAFLSRNVLRNIKIIVPNFMFGKRS
jgi:hypothetical protein